MRDIEADAPAKKEALYGVELDPGSASRIVRLMTFQRTLAFALAAGLCVLTGCIFWPTMVEDMGTATLYTDIVTTTCILVASLHKFIQHYIVELVPLIILSSICVPLLCRLDAASDVCGTFAVETDRMLLHKTVATIVVIPALSTRWVYVVVGVSLSAGLSAFITPMDVTLQSVLAVGPFDAIVVFGVVTTWSIHGMCRYWVRKHIAKLQAANAEAEHAPAMESREHNPQGAVTARPCLTFTYEDEVDTTSDTGASEALQVLGVDGSRIDALTYREACRLTPRNLWCRLQSIPQCHGLDMKLAYAGQVLDWDEPSPLEQVLSRSSPEPWITTLIVAGHARLLPAGDQQMGEQQHGREGGTDQHDGAEGAEEQLGGGRDGRDVRFEGRFHSQFFSLESWHNKREVIAAWQRRNTPEPGKASL